MTTPSVRPAADPEQGTDHVPDRMSLIDSGWRSDDRVNLYLYVDRGRGDGVLTAFAGRGPAVVAAMIADANTFFTMSPTGMLDRPAAWFNAQRAVAHARYKEPVREDIGDDDEY